MRCQAMMAGFLLGALAPSSAAAEIDRRGCLADNSCRHGNSIEDSGFSTEAWVPFKSDDLLVWIADACLGYFMTHDLAVTDGGMIEGESHDEGQENLSVFRADRRARLHIYDWPFNEYGNFHCENTHWPKFAANVAEFESWVAERLTSESGWQCSRKPSAPWGDLVGCRNETLGATIRLYEIVGAYTFRIEADYFGPPIIFVE